MPGLAPPPLAPVCAALLAVLAAVLLVRHVRAVARSRRLALTDELTGLPNRRAFAAHLDIALPATRRAGGALALLMIDLDRFKELNDTLGHAAGDLLLADLGPRLRPLVRTTDMVARLGGDEFAVLMSCEPDGTAAREVAERIRGALDRPFLVDEIAVDVQASVGIALFPAHADDPDELLQRADVAMYRAKSGRTGAELYCARRDPHSRDRLALIGELRAAIAAGEVVLHFQPQADPRTGAIAAVEALVRWEHPQRGLLMPDLVVPLAAHAGLSRALTVTVIEQAVHQAARWHAAGHVMAVAVNVAAADLLATDLAGGIAELLERAGVRPELLTLELTEQSALADPHRLAEALAPLHALGVRLALDDFGTGYSSLTQLSALPVAELKLDRAFIAAMTSEPKAAAIVRATVALAHELEIDVVAEGVEDPAVWIALAELGCTRIQGFYLSRPAPASVLSHWLDDESRLDAARLFAARGEAGAARERVTVRATAPGRPQPVS